MSSWCATVLEAFPQAGSQLIVVADPDGLLRDEQVAAALGARSHDLLTFDDPVAFRYVYESRYREPWRQTVSPSPALIVRTDQPDLRSLPYDLLVDGRQVKLSLQDLVPWLSYPVLRDFFRSAPELLDRLIQAGSPAHAARLSEGRSLAFIAQHVYNLDPAAIGDLSDLVERLLQVHYHGWPLSERLASWLAAELGKRSAFANAPLASWLSDRRAFFTFVEDQWRTYLRSEGLALVETGPVYEVRPLVIDFDRLAIRSTLGTLFLENKLQPVPVVAERTPAGWTGLGTVADTDAHRRGRLADLLKHIRERTPSAGSGHREWLDLAASWAEATVLRHRGVAPPVLDERYAEIQANLAALFLSWLRGRYNALHSVPYLPAPVVGHQVAHALAARMRSDAGRVALLLVDGLSLDGWQVMAEVWKAKEPVWRWEPSALFACLPTITPIARQAIFAGQLPLYFADTWNRTDADERRWRHFWEDQGLFPSAITWQRGLDGLEAAAADPRVRALGLVTNLVDDMVHGTVDGLGELHHRIRRWAEQGELSDAITLLVRAGFDVWLTSDHGCRAAHGIGRPREGVLVEGRGTRVRFYSDLAFLARAQADVPTALAWTPAGLPNALLTLFAPDDAAFANQGEQIVTHGGLSLEEVVVPWVHILPGEGKHDA